MLASELIEARLRVNRVYKKTNSAKRQVNEEKYIL